MTKACNLSMEILESISTLIIADNRRSPPHGATNILQCRPKHFRSFTALNVRNIQYLKSELAALETTLSGLDQTSTILPKATMPGACRGAGGQLKKNGDMSILIV
jgi:hypothetical protein